VKYRIYLSKIGRWAEVDVENGAFCVEGSKICVKMDRDALIGYLHAIEKREEEE